MFERRPLIAIVAPNPELLESMKESIGRELSLKYPSSRVRTFLPKKDLDLELIFLEPDIVLADIRWNAIDSRDMSGIFLLAALANSGISGLISLGLPEEFEHGLKRLDRQDIYIQSAPMIEGLDYILNVIFDTLSRI